MSLKNGAKLFLMLKANGIQFTLNGGREELLVTQIVL